MLVCLISAVVREENSSSEGSRSSHSSLICSLLFGTLLVVSSIFGQDQAPGWQKQVRKYSEAQDWDAALRIVDQEVARAPQD
ncbi:MAG: hypothetical protein QOF56_3402, partial [Acidobacteriaceae bacterium]|nr:hypothetical protein [Acidobacteriaceae bacterium]